MSRICFVNLNFWRFLYFTVRKSIFSFCDRTRFMQRKVIPNSNMRVLNSFRINVLVLSAFGIVDIVIAGSCLDAKLCCPGRDSSCVVQKSPINAIVEDVNEKPCYCDHACLKLGDCCTDFKSACNGK